MKVRKIPHEFDAVCFDPAAAWDADSDWLRQAIVDGRAWYQGGTSPYLTVRTVAGERRVRGDDWILRDEGGELHVVPPALFALTFEAAAIPQEATR